MLTPPEEELETLWYTTLSLPPDNQQHVLDDIASGTFHDVATEIPPNTIHEQQTSVPGTPFEFEPESSSHSGYVTKAYMDESFTIYKQHLVSEVAALYDNLKAGMINLCIIQPLNKFMMLKIYP